MKTASHIVLSVAILPATTDISLAIAFQILLNSSIRFINLK